jgi:hypothetical protein
MSRLQCEGLSYVGGDIVSAVVERNQRLFGGAGRAFVKLDLMRDPLPAADLLLCRDCLVHLSCTDIQTALRNVVRAPIRYLLTTTFPRCERNEDIVTGDWRLLNLQLPPFSFPPPERLIAEGCTEGDGRFGDKSLGLWRMSEIALAVRHASAGRDTA